MTQRVLLFITLDGAFLICLFHDSYFVIFFCFLYKINLSPIIKNICLKVRENVAGIYHKNKRFLS